MTRFNPALLVVTSLLLACPGSGDEDSADATTQTSMTGGILANPDPTTGSESAESTAGETAGMESTVGTDTSDETTAGLNCGVEDIVASVTIPRVMLVLDKSGSMVADPAGYWDADNDDADNDGFVDGDPNMTAATPRITRWQSLYETVDFIVTDFEERMDFGAVLFPSKSAKGIYTAEACPVNAAPDVPIDTDQGSVILSTIPPANEIAKINGGTPATAGMLTGISGLATDNPDDASRPKYIILVTDGAANCPIDPVDAMPSSLFEIYDEQLPVVVGDAFAQMIPTFVVGIDIKDVTSGATQEGNPDNTNTYEKLNEVALAGGQARDGAEKFYNTANQVELQAALMNISELITSCTFDLSKPVNPEFIYLESLVVDESGTGPLMYDKAQVTDCATESGWHYTDETRSAIELCGDACTLFKQTGEVDVVFQCYGQ